MAGTETSNAVLVWFSPSLGGESRGRLWEVEGELHTPCSDGAISSPQQEKASFPPLPATREEATWLSARSGVWEAIQRVHVGLKEVWVGLPLNLRVLLS